MSKWYNSLLIDKSMSWRPPNQGKGSNNCAANVLAVVTMWHETRDEMITILESIFRMDKDQFLRRNNKIVDPHFYHYEIHVFFDDAFKWHSNDDITYCRVVNCFVNQLIELMDKMNSKRPTPIIFVCPYGGRLEWTLPGNTKMTVHLKDKIKIRIKKRWSQVMYIDYLMRYAIENHLDLDNTYLLTLDGDMDFRPKAVHILVDIMNSQRDVAIACNRSLPTGSPGPTVWYQIFEYAMGFWLQKPCEYVLGNVLCAAGCFSLIRSNVLLDGEVMTKFADHSTKARHFIERDQGEDRWLCTLLIKRGYKIAYSSSSYAYTRCPETFDEFYNQRRRWTLSIISNTFDLLCNCRQIVKQNKNISWAYVIFQALLLVMGLLCPASIFLVLVNTSATTFFFEKWISLAVHSVLILIFIVTCFLAPSCIQLRVAKLLSAFYGIIIAAMAIHSLISLADYDYGIEKIFSLSNAFVLFVASCALFAAFLHPREILCLLAAPIYLLLTPSMGMLLVLYSVINMNVVSWGTRDSNSEIPNMRDMKLDNQATNDDTKMSAENSRSANLDSSNWNLEEEYLLSKQRTVTSLPEEERSFWKDLIRNKLFPFVQKEEEKDRISTELIKLRNFSFANFFVLNFIFVATIFAFQMKDETPESNNFSDELTLSKRIWLSNPAQLTVIIFAGSMLFIQCAALLYFRLNNLIRIISSPRNRATSNANAGDPVVLLSYNKPTVHSSEARNHDFCHMNTNTWI